MGPYLSCLFGAYQNHSGMRPPITQTPGGRGEAPSEVSRMVFSGDQHIHGKHLQFQRLFLIRLNQGIHTKNSFSKGEVIDYKFELRRGERRFG